MHCKVKVYARHLDGLDLQTGTLLGGNYSWNLIGKGIHTNQTYMRQMNASDVSFFIYT